MISIIQHNKTKQPIFRKNRQNTWEYVCTFNTRSRLNQNLIYNPMFCDVQAFDEHMTRTRVFFLVHTVRSNKRLPHLTHRLCYVSKTSKSSLYSIEIFQRALPLRSIICNIIYLQFAVPRNSYSSMNLSDFRRVMFLLNSVFIKVMLYGSKILPNWKQSFVSPVRLFQFTRSIMGKWAQQSGVTCGSSFFPKMLKR